MVTKIPETSNLTKTNGGEKKRKAKTEMNRTRKSTCKSNKMTDEEELISGFTEQIFCVCDSQIRHMLASFT